MKGKNERMTCTLQSREAIVAQANAAHNTHNTVDPRMREAFEKAEKKK